MKRAALILLAALGAAQPALAASRPVTDCPLRDAPFSLDTPWMDVLLSPAARAVVEQAAPGAIAKLPARFAGTTPPNFAAIQTMRDAARRMQLSADSQAIIATELRKLPVTAADRVARCARYDNDVPTFSLPAGKPKLLVFEKINGFKDTPSVDAAHAALQAMAERKGWAIAFTDKGGTFNPRTLRQFDAIVWNNISGDVLTLAQRRSFRTWIERGGAYIGIHGSAGDPAYFWDWYADGLIGARFIGHPMSPQFQDARVVVEDSKVVGKGLPAAWTMNDEWYSFRTSPRTTGATVIATLDESTYSQVGMMNQDLRMGDHPIAWRKCIGRGRMVYSAIGHRPETYDEPNHVRLLESAIEWAALTGKGTCPARR